MMMRGPLTQNRTPHLKRKKAVTCRGVNGMDIVRPYLKLTRLRGMKSDPYQNLGTQYPIYI
jgi:hypothetical protein